MTAILKMFIQSTVGASALAMALAAAAGEVVAEQANDLDLCALVQQTGKALQARGSTQTAVPNMPALVKTLEERIGIPTSLFVLWPTSDKRLERNAASQLCFGQPYIFFDQQFFASPTRTDNASDWMKFFTFAHEIGHHQLHHFTVTKARRTKELEADEYAGWALAAVRVNAPELMTAVDSVQPDDAGSDAYPDRCARREAALSGYNRYTSTNGGMTWSFVPPCSVRPNAPSSSTLNRSAPAGSVREIGGDKPDEATKRCGLGQGQRTFSNRHISVNSRFGVPNIDVTTNASGTVDWRWDANGGLRKWHRSGKWTELPSGDCELTFATAARPFNMNYREATTYAASVEGNVLTLVPPSGFTRLELQVPNR